MAIQTSSARDVDALLQQLRSQVGHERDTAIARLRVIGARAHRRVLSLIADPSADSGVRVAALRVVDAVDDVGVRRAVIAATSDNDPAVAIAALHVLRPWLVEDTDTTILEVVSALVVDLARPVDVRRAALEALSDLPASITEPLVQSVTAQLATAPVLDDPTTARDWLANHEDSSLSMLHDLLAQARDRQRRASDAGQRAEWLALRVAAHAAIARRGSRIALYDARELFENAQSALPLDLLTAVRTIGDASCLEALARAWDRVADDAWWREQLQDVAAAVVRREKITSRTAAMKRVRTRYPAFLDKDSAIGTRRAARGTGRPLSG